ncbi:MAG: GNAT family N-acetyltransferase [Planctomycetota bacterium]
MHVTVPESMRVPIPESGKIVNTELFRLECIGKALDTMKLLTMRVGWNQTDRDVNRIIDFDPRGTFAAYLKGKGFKIPIATATVAPRGRNNTWIGMILVHPEMRRQGVANYMMQVCVKYAVEQGKVINGLDATPMGNTVYGAVGYVDSFRIWRSVYKSAEFANASYDKAHVSRITKKDLDGVIQYDASNYLEREAILRALYADCDGEAYVFRNDNGEVAGYVLGRPGRIRPFVGPFIADSEAIARELLDAISSSYAARGEETLFIDTPEEKFDDRGVYARGVFDQERKPSRHRLIRDIACVRDFTRMYQVVDPQGAERLVKEFREKENLSPGDPRVREFAAVMHRSVQNRSETAAYMEYEAKVLQKKIWGDTGPEKG